MSVESCKQNTDHAAAASTNHTPKPNETCNELDLSVTNDETASTTVATMAANDAAIIYAPRTKRAELTPARARKRVSIEPKSNCVIAEISVMAATMAELRPTSAGEYVRAA